MTDKPEGQTNFSLGGYSLSVYSYNGLNQTHPFLFLSHVANKINQHLVREHIEQTKNFRKSSKINLRWTNRTGMRMHTHPSCCLLHRTLTHTHTPASYSLFLFRPSFMLKNWDTDGVVGALQRYRVEMNDWGTWKMNYSCWHDTFLTEPHQSTFWTPLGRAFRTRESVTIWCLIIFHHDNNEIQWKVFEKWKTTKKKN